MQIIRSVRLAARLSSRRWGALGAALGVAASLMAGTAHAGDVYWSVGMASPGVSMGFSNAAPVMSRLRPCMHRPPWCTPPVRWSWRHRRCTTARPWAMCGRLRRRCTKGMGAAGGGAITTTIAAIGAEPLCTIALFS